MNPAAADGHYEVMDFDTHYETASNFQFELPALPYEVPTPSVSCDQSNASFRTYSLATFNVNFLEQISSHRIWKSTMGHLCANRGM